MKVKMHNTERFSKKDNLLIPLPPNFSFVSGSLHTGSALVIKDNTTKSIYRWLPKEVAIELINTNLSKLKRVVDDATYEDAKNQCEKLKEDIFVCKAVFQKITNQVESSMTFRLV